MKKLIAIFFTSLFFMSTAYAGGMVGIKVGFGELHGERTSSGESGATSGSVDSEYGAIFAEANLADTPVSLGIELVPMEGVIDTKNDANSADTEVTVSNLITAYVLAEKETDFGSIYGKLGYATVDLEAKSGYGLALSNASKEADGPMVGIGAQFEVPTPIINTVRLEATHTMFGEVKLSTTDGDGGGTADRTGEADLTTFSISLARSF